MMSDEEKEIFDRMIQALEQFNRYMEQLIAIADRMDKAIDDFATARRHVHVRAN